MLNRMIDVEKIPDEVMWVLMVSSGFVGRSTYDKCQEIISRYPEYFPWEHKYKSIPKEVHEAYLDEVNPLRHEPIVILEGGLHLRDQIRKEYISINKTVTQKDFEDMFNEMAKMEQERIEKRKKEKALWDKHYKIYGLEYKG